MKETTKNYLGVAIIISILIVAFSSWSFVRSYSRSIEPSSFRSFSVSGEGKIVAVPDVAEFSFSVITQGGTDIASSQKTNTEKTNAAIDFVKSKGVDAKDIKTASYNLEPRYQYYNCLPNYLEDGSVRPCPPAEIVGYTVTQTVLVKVRDFTKIGDILGGVVGAGANSVSQLSFTIDDEEKVQAEAREEAINVAKGKAESIAKAAGFSVGRLLSISESGVYPRAYYAKEMAYGLGGGDTAAAVPSIEPGSQEVTVDVTLTYEIR
ncbi:MAG: SIMPL domain-containing protein [Candidatus Jorgensenbacteria bacterium]